jgi:ligand-binding sensor domain-containing protein
MLIDTTGKQCVISIGNKATGKVSKLELRNTINAMNGWKPAFAKNKTKNVSITLRFDFANEIFKVSYDRFDPNTIKNVKSVGEAEVTNKTSNSKILKNEFEVYTTQNSVLPWDMTRAISIDTNNVVWLGTDNGIVKIENNKFSVLTPKNSALRARKNETTIMNSDVDIYNNKWFADNAENVYKFDGTKWTVFDSTNSPIKWTTGVYADKMGNAWFALYEKFPQTKGFAKYSPAGEWTVINTENSKMPRNDVLDFAINEKTNTIWFSINRAGVSQFDGKNWATFSPDNSKVPSTYIQSIAVDKDGNVWCATFAGLLKIIPQ